MDLGPVAPVCERCGWPVTTASQVCASCQIVAMGTALQRAFAGLYITADEAARAFAEFGRALEPLAPRSQRPVRAEADRRPARAICLRDDE